MTASLHRLGAGSEAGTYYTSDSAREARPDRRDEYYVRDGGGVWWTTRGSVVRHGAAIDLGSFRDLCAGIDPRTGKALVRGAGPTHWAGLDLTLTPGKSVSVLWMAGTPEQREAIEAAHRQAVSRALRLLADEELVVVRSGAGGSVRHAPTDLIVGRFDHFTTREGDPNLHTHCVLMNVAGAPTISGRYSYRHLTIDPEGVFRWQRVIGAAYRSALARELTEKFNLSFREAGEGQWEIAGIPQAVLQAFSKRSAQIEAFAGPDATSAQREVAALATRKGKALLPTGDELEARWLQELVTLGSDPWERAQAPNPHMGEHGRDHDRDRPIDPPEVPGDGLVAGAASELFRHESVIDRKDLMQLSFERAGLRGLGPEAVDGELARLQADGSLLVLGDKERSQRWTTAAIATCEAAMLRAAERPDERDWITEQALSDALAAAKHLSPEQQDAVRSVATRDGVALIEAGAGTGKTTAARTLVDAAQRSGLSVIGLSPSWVAADELAVSTGIPAQAIARWRQDRANGCGPALDGSCLILLDEAGMVGTRDMAAVMTAAQGAGAKVVLLCDRRQLASVPGASALRAVADIVERSAVMTEVRRQEVDWQKAATVAMARGDSEAGLRAYAMHGRLELVARSEAAQDRTIALWQKQRQVHGNDVLIVTRRNADVSELNRKAREALRQEGRLGPDLVALPSLDRSDKRVEIDLAVGDRIRFGETLPRLGIRNGHRATIKAITAAPHGAARLTLRLEDGHSLIVPWSELSREPRFGQKPTPPRIVHAHAGTAHSVQGRSATATVLYLARATDAREVYVGLSRHRHDAHIVVERDRLDALCRQRQADPRVPASDTAVRERLFKEAALYREKANVVDYATDRATFKRTGLVTTHNRERIRLRPLLEAQRTLKQAFDWLRRRPQNAISRLALSLHRGWDMSRDGPLTKMLSEREIDRPVFFRKPSRSPER